MPTCKVCKIEEASVGGILCHACLEEDAAIEYCVVRHIPFTIYVKIPGQKGINGYKPNYQLFGLICKANICIYKLDRQIRIGIIGEECGSNSVVVKRISRYNSKPMKSSFDIVREHNIKCVLSKVP